MTGYLRFDECSNNVLAFTKLRRTGEVSDILSLCWSKGCGAYVSLALYLPVGPAAKLAARGIEGASVSRPALVVPQGPGLALAHA